VGDTYTKRNIKYMTYKIVGGGHKRCVEMDWNDV
jgi:hypothetical protein